MAPKKKTVLFVDDDLSLLEILRQLMGHYAGEQWEVLTASDVSKGLSILQERRVDLLVFDIQMPVVDGVQFLKLLQRKYPNLLKVVLTGFASEETRASCLNDGAELYLEKPRDQGGWQGIHATLHELTRFQPEEGFRAYTDEREIQHALDAGALVLVVPTVDTVEEAREAVNWAYFPPLGRRSNGGGQAFDPAMWGNVPGGYRNTINDNLVLVLMIETLEGLKNADAIAKVPGVSAVFAASGDLGNFSGYRQGSPDYERAINIVHDAAIKAGVRLCGPMAWRDRPDFTCFQGGSETAAIARGVAAELGALANTQGKVETGPFAKD